MKSERRHELEHNELAQWLFETGEQLRPYQNLILALVAAVAIVIVGYSWWVRHNATQTTRAWAELGRALEGGNPDVLAAVAEEYPNTVVSQMANAMLGDLHLLSASNQRFANMTMAERELRTAQDLYSKVLEKDLSQMLRERATFGMARVKETAGEVDAARQFYAEVVDQWPNGAFAAAAKQRLADFKEPETKLMLADFRKYAPKGEFSDEPGAFASPGPSEPTFDMPQEPPIRNPNDVRPGEAFEKDHPGQPEKSPPATGQKPAARDRGLGTSVPGEPKPEAGKTPATQPKKP